MRDRRTEEHIAVVLSRSRSPGIIAGVAGFSLVQTRKYLRQNIDKTTSKRAGVDGFTTKSSGCIRIFMIT